MPAATGCESVSDRGPCVVLGGVWVSEEMGCDIQRGTLLPSELRVTFPLPFPRCVIGKDDD